MGFLRTTAAPMRTTTPPPKKYTNADGPGGTTVDYGPGSRDTRFDGGKAPFGKSPWYSHVGSPDRMPWPGPDDGSQTVGKRAPLHTPDPGDPRNDGYFVAPPSAEKEAAWESDIAKDSATRNSMLANDPAYQAALKSGDPIARAHAMTELARKGQHDYWAAKGMKSPQEIFHDTGGIGGIAPRVPTAGERGGAGVGAASTASAPGDSLDELRNHKPSIDDIMGSNVGSQSGGSSMITGYDPGPGGDGGELGVGALGEGAAHEQGTPPPGGEIGAEGGDRLRELLQMLQEHLSGGGSGDGMDLAKLMRKISRRWSGRGDRRQGGAGVTTGDGALNAPPADYRNAPPGTDMVGPTIGGFAKAMGGSDGLTDAQRKLRDGMPARFLQGMT